jgi:hypothetical protein
MFLEFDSQTNSEKREPFCGLQSPPLRVVQGALFNLLGDLLFFSTNGVSKAQ